MHQDRVRQGVPDGGPDVFGNPFDPRGPHHVPAMLLKKLRRCCRSTLLYDLGAFASTAGEQHDQHPSEQIGPEPFPYFYFLPYEWNGFSGPANREVGCSS